MRIPDRILFQWHVTGRCNLHCGHCYQDLPPTADPLWDELLAILEQFKSFIVNRRKSTAGRTFRAHVTVTGGEPFLREDFPLLLERLAREERLFSFAILTNGTLLTPAMVRSLRHLRPSFVQVSIDGTCKTHNNIRGATSHERAVAAIKLLVGAKIPVYISFTAHRGNYRDFPSVARLGCRLGVTRIWSDRMVPPREPGNQAREMLMTPDETREFIGIMERERQRGLFRQSRVVLHRSLQFTATGTLPYRCGAGDTLVTVLPNGDVCPCRRMPLVAGNIHNDPLEYLYNSELFRGLRDRERISGGCEKCFYARDCGGGARCIAWALHGNPFHADPGCWLSTRAGTPNPI